MTRLVLSKNKSVSKLKTVNKLKESRFGVLVEKGLPPPHRNFTKNILAMIEPEIKKMESTIHEYENTISNLKKELIVSRNETNDCKAIHPDLKKPEILNISDEEKNKLRSIRDELINWSESKWQDIKTKKIESICGSTDRQFKNKIFKEHIESEFGLKRTREIISLIKRN